MTTPYKAGEARDTQHAAELLQEWLDDGAYVETVVRDREVRGRVRVMSDNAKQRLAEPARVLGIVVASAGTEPEPAETVNRHPCDPIEIRELKDWVHGGF